MPIKLKWYLAPVPTGRCRSFEKRAWPVAFHTDCSPAAMICCVDGYTTRLIATGKHAVLTLRIADYSTTPRHWRRVIKVYNTLAEAKAAVPELLRIQPKMLPEYLRPKGE